MFDSCICINPDDTATLLGRRQRKARKRHKCGECNHTIHPGQMYEADAIVFEGEFTIHKTCILCVRVRNSLFECGWYYGGVWEDVHEACCDGDECICPSPETDAKVKP